MPIGQAPEAFRLLDEHPEQVMQVVLSFDSRRAAGRGVTFRLAAQESTLPGDTLLEKFSFARDCGFDGIELGGAGNGVFAGRTAELREARRAGVVMSLGGDAHRRLPRRLRPRIGGVGRLPSCACC